MHYYKATVIFAVYDMQGCILLGVGFSCAFSVVSDLCVLMDCRPLGSSFHGNFSDKNTGHFLLQGIFLTQGSISGLLHLLHWQVDSCPLVPPGKPQISLYPMLIWNQLVCIYIYTHILQTTCINFSFLIIHIIDSEVCVEETIGLFFH